MELTYLSDTPPPLPPAPPPTSEEDAAEENGHLPIPDDVIVAVSYTQPPLPPRGENINPPQLPNRHSYK
ncbi:hypothetical protein CHUAL_003818 [Chamberlinius hualienensis]